MDLIQLIKRPMDVKRMRDRIRKGQYHHTMTFLMDCHLIWANAYAFNHETSQVCTVCP